MKKVYSIKELKDILHLGERTIFKYLSEGLLNGSKHGKWLFTEDDIKEFLAKGKKRIVRRKK